MPIPKKGKKKKRRLEKALATSAAIRSELEKKKQRKKEEQQRLDEEGAAIAEAVALHVLIGEDAEDSHRFMCSDKSGNIGLFTGYQSWSAHGYESGYKWNNLEIGCERSYRGGEASAGLIAAQAVLLLQIAEDSREGLSGTHYGSSQMLGVGSIGDRLDLYREF